MTETTLPTLYQQFIHISRYARWRPELGRRETWEETVDRYFDFFLPHLKENHDYEPSAAKVKWLREGILSLKYMPSMRCLMTAGPALAKNHVAGYNCSYRAIDDARAFSEIFFILMSGVGVGFSVERQFVGKLGIVPAELKPSDHVIDVRDSRKGWADGLKDLLNHLYKGEIPTWDMSKVRKAGERLQTMGGRASGPEPLERLFKFIIGKFQDSADRQLASIDCHDIVCAIGDCVVVGSVRRSALISLSNLSDERMRNAKAGQWSEDNPQRALANNSVAYTEKPDEGRFMAEWIALHRSRSGERGIFNREGVDRRMEELPRRTSGYEWGTNPCSEIILRNQEFCNLTEVIARQDDDMESLKDKIKAASVLGTWQSTLIKFDSAYLGVNWRRNCEEERLLGVSITGIFDNKILSDYKHNTEALEELKRVAIQANKDEAKKLGISQSAAITCVKPSGTVSQLVNSASGIHPRRAQFYIRRVRQSINDPLTKFMQEAGFPNEPDVMKPDHDVVFSFPVRATKPKPINALEHLEMWLQFQKHFCEHKPSVTITVEEGEWLKVAAWLYENFDEASGLSFLPGQGSHIYQQAPEETVSEKELKEFEKLMPKTIDWLKLGEYEDEDNTVASRELACVAGTCDITGD